MKYIAVIHHDPGSAFGVSFPDFPGCITAGKTFEEARARAAEALRLCIEETHAAGGSAGSEHLRGGDARSRLRRRCGVFR